MFKKNDFYNFFTDFTEEWKTKVLIGIFEFICSGFEMDIPRNILVAVHLPNVMALGRYL